jgi:hypothetical protein
MCAFFVLSASFAQADGVRCAVASSNRRPGADAWTAKVLSAVRSALRAEELELVDERLIVDAARKTKWKETTRCGGSIECLGSVAKMLGGEVLLVGVDVGRVAKSLAVQLEAVAADGVSVVSLSIVTSSSADEAQLADKFADFASQVAKQTPPKVGTPERNPPGTPDVPMAANLEPNSTIDLVPFPTTESKSTKVRLRPLVLGLGAGAVVGIGTAITLAALGAGDRARFNDSLTTTPGGIVISSLPESQAKALADGANAKFTGALVSAVVGALLTGGAT